MKGFLALRYTLFIHTLLLPSLYAATSIPDSGVQSTSGLRAHSRHASWRFQSHTKKFSVSWSPLATNEVTSELALTTMTTSSASIISPTTSTTTSTTPAQQHTDTIAAKDIETIHERRLRTIIGSLSVANISSWYASLSCQKYACQLIRTGVRLLEPVESGLTRRWTIRQDVQLVAQIGRRKIIGSVSVCKRTVSQDWRSSVTLQQL